MKSQKIFYNSENGEQLNINDLNVIIEAHDNLKAMQRIHNLLEPFIKKDLFTGGKNQIVEDLNRLVLHFEKQLSKTGLEV